VKGRWEELAVDGDGPGDAQTRVTAARQTQIRRVTQPRANVRPRAAGHDAARRRCDSIHRRQRPARGAPNVGGRRLRAASRERPVGHSVASVATAPAAIARVDRWADAVAHESAAVAAGAPVTGRTWDSLGARWAGPGGARSAAPTACGTSASQTPPVSTLPARLIMQPLPSSPGLSSGSARPAGGGGGVDFIFSKPTAVLRGR
jgi:hypothetical protein